MKARESTSFTYASTNVEIIDLYNVDWNFTSFPSQAFKDFFGQALGQYASGSMEWEDVKEAFITSWADEKAMTGN